MDATVLGPRAVAAREQAARMADRNNDRVGSLPAKPSSVLRSLDRLVGRWTISGGFFEGSIAFEWMEGGFFLVQHVDARAGGQRVKGIEYIGFDEATQSLRSHYMDVHGANFAYAWELDGDSLRIWFGDRGSDTRFVGRFGPDGDSYVGRWEWPGGGYEVVATRVRDP